MGVSSAECVVVDPGYLGPPSDSTTSDPATAGSSTSSTTTSMDSIAGTEDGSTGSTTTSTGPSSSGTSSGTGAPIPEGVLLWTTLDDASAVTMPLVGDAAEATSTTMPANDFVPTPQGGGVRIDEMGEYVRYRQIADAANIEFDRGTIEFWYRPDYDSADGQRYRLVATDGSTSGLRIRKAMTDRFAMVLFDATGMEHITSVGPLDYQWSAGQWIHIRVTWDTLGSPGSPAVHIYFDGVEVPQYDEVAAAGITMGDEEPSGWLYIGARSDGTPSVASGILDEFIVYDEPVPPP